MLEDVRGDRECTGVGRGKTPPTQHFTIPSMQRSGPAPHLGKVGELALVSWAQEGLQTEQLSPATSQAHIQGIELVTLTSTYLIYELPELIKRPVLHIQSCRIFLTKRNNRYPRGVAVG